MGNGAFNLVCKKNTFLINYVYNMNNQMISNLPQRVIRYLEFVGFSGDRV